MVYLKFTRRTYKGKEFRHALLVEGYRNKRGGVTQRTITNLGPVHNKEDEDRFRLLVQKVKKGECLVRLKETNQDVLEFGVRLVVEHLWRSLTINDLLHGAKVSYPIWEVLMMLVVHRLHCYGSENISEREGHRWVMGEAFHTLPKTLQLQHVYRSLFILLKNKDAIEKQLCDELNPKKEIVFYDLTSSYVEGAYKASELIDFGYNRDNKRGRKQVVFGLLLAEGLPLAHQVWGGNTADKTTLKEAVSRLKELGVKRFVFVADRGICTEQNVTWLEDQKLEYIIATRRRRDVLVKKLMITPIAEEVKKVYVEKGRTYYLCYNKKVAGQQRQELERIKENVVKKIRAIKRPTEHKVLDAVGKAKKFFTFSFEKKFSYVLNEDVWDYEKTIAGKFLLITNNNTLSKEKIVGTYKQLMHIEQCFRQLKHFEDMRPIFHKSDDGIKAHIFLAVLTLLIEKLINKHIPDMTTRQVITELKKIKLSRTKTYLVRTDLTPVQQEILEKIGISEPTKIV